MKHAAAILLILIAFCLAMITALTIRPASADPQVCAPERAMLDHLAANFHEFVVLTGSAADQHVIVTLSRTGTFSVLVTDGKTACMFMAGEKAELDNGI